MEDNSSECIVESVNSGAEFPITRERSLKMGGSSWRGILRLSARLEGGRMWWKRYDTLELGYSD